LFSSGQIYSNLLWFFLAGPVVVVITYLLGRKWKRFNYLSWPVAFGAMSLVPPATGVSFSSWWVINVIFNGVLRRRKPAWWSKYSESLSFLFPPIAKCRCRLRAVCRAGLRRRSGYRHHFLLHYAPSRFF
jgi:hypothetical protein